MKNAILTITALALLAGATAVLQTGCTTNPAPSAQAAAKPYPLDYCLVSGDKIGAMGRPIVLVYHGQEIKFCCADCPPEFNKDPEKYMKKLADAEANTKK
jgi:YHS domain-containing protein